MFPARRTLTSVLTVVLVAVAAFVGTDAVAPTSAQAADPSAFRPGSLISDALFFDGGAMTTGDVQSFLNSKGAACSGSLCLKNYVTSSSSQPAEAGLCAAYDGVGAESAAQIVARVGAACGVSQKALLVTLQKEQGLVTTTSPTEGRYRTAMGFGCPDTAPCDAQYFGFFNQVYRAARQFKRYAASPQNYSYRAGRTNNVLFHPNGACGSSPVYIENQATAGLYTYTPYQPNASALGNLYGTGDGCASYGNRNFWRDYTDWFGSTQVGASLVRTAGDPTVYLVTFDRKYRVADLAVLDSLNPLGAVGIVQQSFLDSKTTGVTMGRFLRDSAGTIWFVDRGQLFSVADCSQLGQWGASCADYGSMALSDVQMAGFQKSGPLTFAAYTPEGKKYAIYGGAKHEVADEASSYLHPTAGTPVRPIAESSLSYLPYGAPLVRPGIIVRDRATGQEQLVDVDRSLALAPGLTAETSLRRLGVYGLDHGSVALMPTTAATVTGLIKGRDGSAYAMTGQSLVRLGADQMSQLRASAPTLSDGIVAALGPVVAGTVFVRSVESGALFVAVNNVKRSVATMDLAAAVAGPGGPVVTFVAQSALNQVPEWTPAIAPGRLIKAEGSSQIYLTDGAGTLQPITSFAVTDAIGAGGWSEVNPGYVNVSRIASQPLSAAVACGSLRYVGSGGKLVPVDPGTLDASGTPTTTLDPATCAALPRAGASAVGTVMIKGPDTPALFVATGGLKRPVTSMATAFALAAPGGLLLVPVPQAALDAMPTHVDMLAPGSLVKSSDSPDIYLVDGTSSLVRLPTFEIASALGLTGWSTVAPGVIGAHSVAASPLGTAVSCGPTRAVGSGGRLVTVDTGTFDAAGVPATRLTTTTCANLPRGGSSGGPVFLRTAGDPTLYLAQSGTKRPVATMAQVYWLTGGQNPLVALVADTVLAAVPNGPPV